MPHSPEIITTLNRLLAHELAAINQYFLHARVLKYMGIMELADREYKESISTMKHTDQLVQRVLELGGMPNLHQLSSLHTGSDVAEIIAGDTSLAACADADLQAAVALCSQHNDGATLAVLHAIAARKKSHADALTS